MIHSRVTVCDCCAVTCAAYDAVYATRSKHRLGTFSMCRPQKGASWNNSHAATACTSASVTAAPGAGTAGIAGACWAALSASPAAGSSRATSPML